MIKEMYERGMNISDIARELGIDRKTVRKYIHSPNPPSKSKRKQRKSKLDPFKDYLQKRMLEDGVFNSEKLFFEIRQQGYTGGKTILKVYIKPFRETAKKKYTVRYETEPGEQAQFDWKENIRYVTKEGEILNVNIGVFLLSHSRFRAFLLILSKSQSVLVSFLMETFEKIGGVPKIIVFDNMKTVMDEARTEYSKGVVNDRFDQFAKDRGFDIHPCKAGRPYTKGKVEATMKLIDEIHAYQGQFLYEELQNFVQSLCERINPIIKGREKSLS